MKGVVNPLLWFLVLQLWCWWLLRRRGASHAGTARAVLLLTVVSLWGFSTQFLHRALQDLWVLPETELGVLKPEYLVVLAGGWRPGEAPAEDFLEVETQRRLLHGVGVWRRHPAAKLVLSGSAGEFGRLRNAARQVELMADTALRLGVPSPSIILEGLSANTSEHAVEARKLPGIAAATPIGIVTTDWHIRRAYMEFCRHFENIALYPVAPMRHLGGWRDWMPSAGALRDNGVLLQEWVGLLWYEIRGRFQDKGGVPRCRR